MRDFAKVFRADFDNVFRNGGVVLVLIFAPLIYSLLYSSGYAKQVLFDVPIAVIDCSHTASSRELTRRLDASPYICTSYKLQDIQSAKRALMERKIYGIVYIPESYQADIESHNQSCISLYCDAGYFLMYRQIMQGATGAIFSLNRELAPERSVVYQSHTLFNPYLGYGTFIMPAVLIVILQQTALVAICMVGGLWSERRLYNRYRSALSVVMAKCTLYVPICAVIASYILAIHYQIFNYPTNGSTTAIIAVILPFILSTVLLSITLSTLFKTLTTPLIVLLWSSIPVLLLSGASLPPEAFPGWMYTLGKLLPSSSAVPAFIRVQSMGGGVGNVLQEICTLWGLTALYGVAALFAIKKRMPGRTTKSQTSNLPLQE